MIHSGRSSIPAVALVCGTLVAALALAETSAAQQSGPKGSAAGQADKESSGIGFSMESEMLTYAALERESKAVACDVARYLNATSAVSPESSLAESPCEMPAGRAPETIMVLSSNSKILADFDLWRADLAAMDSLLYRVHQNEVACKKGQGGATINAPGPLKGLVNFTLPGGAFSAEALPLLQNVLATTESTSPVSGTIEDQAFMDAAARQFRVLGVRVLMPDAYTPFSLAVRQGLDYPVIGKAEELEYASACLDTKLTQYKESPEWRASNASFSPAAARKLLGDIDAFLLSVFGGQTNAAQNPDQSKVSDHPSGTDGQEPAKAEPLVPFSPAHLASLLRADLLADKLKIDPDRPTPAEHILWLKALESGGSITKTGNFLGTKIRYSGGAVGTYALFNLEGELECSGNVYDYGGPLRGKDFGKESQPTKSDSKRVILEGGCKPLQGSASTSR
jgi:hypothetical protein